MNDMHQMRSFNRFELKYILHRQEAEDFKTDIKRHLLPDVYGDGDGNYVISSLYFDSIDYRCYWEKIEGIKFRRKLRIRYYETKEKLKDDTQVFTEIKQRYDRVTQKRRVKLPFGKAKELCRGMEMGDSKENHKTIEEIRTIVDLYALQPACVISYFRQAFIGTDYDIGLRVTFDTNLKYNVKDLMPRFGGNGHSLLPPEYVIMEIKVNNRVPFWLTEMVAGHNLRLHRISKYCTGISRAENFPADVMRAY